MLSARIPKALFTAGRSDGMMEFLLNTGSTIDEGRLAKGGNKLTVDYT